MPDEPFTSGPLTAKLADINRLSTIGLICASWANLESIFAFAIWLMLGLDNKTGRIVTGGLDMRPRANMAIRLAQHFNAPKELEDALVEARKTIEDGLLVKRNLVVHGIHQLRDRDEELLLDLHRGKTPEPTRFGDNELLQLEADITNTSKKLGNVVSKHYLLLAEIMAKKTATATSDTKSTSGS